MMKVCICGLGYIGLPTAALLANRGFFVHGVDVIREVVDTINQGHIHIIEPELDTFVRSAVRSGTLEAHLQPAEADVFMIAVPTPFKAGNLPDLSFVMQAAESIAPYLRPGNLVILESTSPIGTTEAIAALFNSRGTETKDLYIAYCPERVLPGNVMKELISNDRIVGGLDRRSTEKVAAFYRSFVSGAVLETEARTAELCKLAENSYRDTNIAFANELSIICDAAGINVWELIKLANKHPRVNILQPGTGVGGHCIAVDPWFIISDYPQQSRIIRTSREVNNYKTEWVEHKILALANRLTSERGARPLVAIYGLAFKPNIDDLRESPAVRVLERISQDFECLAVEPHITKHPRFELRSALEALTQADLHVFLVAHNQFKNLDLAGLDVLDFCNLDRE